jgi:hypothetical protein
MATSIDPEKSYRVKLAHAVEIHPGVWARPGDVVVLIGSLLSSDAIQDKVESYEEA